MCLQTCSLEMHIVHITMTCDVTQSKTISKYVGQLLFNILNIIGMESFLSFHLLLHHKHHDEAIFFLNLVCWQMEERYSLC